MNLKNIKIEPFAQGIIKIDSTTDEMTGDVRTLNHMVVCSRQHASEPSDMPKLAPHPIHEGLLHGVEPNADAQRIVEIPIKMFFDKTENSIAIKYQAFSSDGVPVCSGNGKSCMRLTKCADDTDTYEQHACMGSEQCGFASLSDVKCRRQVKMVVQIDGQDDELSVFQVRSSSLNSYRTLQAQLKMIESRCGGLRHVPLKLTLWQASNQASQYQPFDLFRLSFNAASEVQALKLARAKRLEIQEAGIIDATDEIFASAGDEDLNGLEDFTLVSDFYDSEPAIRRGPKPSASLKDSLGGNAKSEASVGIAHALIRQAVLGAASQASEESQSLLQMAEVAF